MKLKTAARFCLDLLFPPRCVFCGCVVRPLEQVCTSCRSENQPAQPMERMQLAAGGNTIPCVAVYRYDGSVREAILRYKFGGEKGSAAFFAGQLAKQLAGEEKIRFDAVTCVPLSSERKKQRGYNQSELIARGAAEILGVSYEQTLLKVKHNSEQHLLSRAERIQNVHGVYRVRDGVQTGKSYLLVDDIVTTGSTLSECASVLLLSGAKAVACAAVACAPLQKDDVENQRTM